MDNVLISVIVPCYNQVQYLDECLQSVLEQSYRNWECIIVNDGSPDHTDEIAKKWLSEDYRFKYFEKKNGGLSSARNFGIENAIGEWILPLDADDRISSDYLALAQEKFSGNYTAVYSDAEFFGDKDGLWQLPEFSLEKLAIHNLLFCSSFFRKSDWLLAGKFDENLKSGYEDWEFFIRLLEKKPLVYKIPRTCFFYRIKEKSMTTDLHLLKEKKAETLKYIYLKHPEFFINNSKIPYQNLYYENLELKNKLKNSVKENQWLKSQVNSKRFKFANFFFSIIDRFKK